VKDPLARDASDSMSDSDALEIKRINAAFEVALRSG
jgi:hypothetical protein